MRTGNEDSEESWVWTTRYLHVRTFYVLRQLKNWWLLAHLLHHQSLHVFVISIQQLKLVGEGKGDLCFGHLNQWVLLAVVICIQSSFTWVSEFHIIVLTAVYCLFLLISCQWGHIQLDFFAKGNTVAFFTSSRWINCWCLKAAPSEWMKLCVCYNFTK